MTPDPEAKQKRSLVDDILGDNKPPSALATGDEDSDLAPSGKMSSAKAGYMELKGATKDGDCSHVEVAGGVSQQLGCCNEFDPQDEDVDRFTCGKCEYVTQGGA